MRTRIALVTCARLPDLAPDEALLVHALAERGIDGIAAVWDAPGIGWKSFDAVVMRSAWDYHLKADAFLAWIGAIESAGIPLWNPAPLLRWNSNKRYLGDLGNRGVNVVPTRWADATTTISLAGIMDKAGWRDVVVKPEISATAHRTFRLHRDAADAFEAQFQSLRLAQPMMVQPTVREILTEGEWSLCFFGGEFSHALRKRPAAGDFRVQDEHGGSARLDEPPSRLVADAKRTLGLVQWPWAYARVDCCSVDERLLLMELEMLEPTFYLNLAPEAAERFAAVIERLVRTG
ncbi:MAG TPA: hypothetical protein VGI92_06115 [Gemmatimonadales bacterium]|jgi:glutathione synthase/RimK-type ligase-like ATP-grasp enzyme